MDAKELTLTYELLARDDLKPIDKLIYSIIEKELVSTGCKFVSHLTDPHLAKMTGVSKSTVQRAVHHLDKKKMIAIVSENFVPNRDPLSKHNQIMGVRYIYLNRKQAGYRKRRINKSKRPMELSYLEHVIWGGMSEESYVKMMQEETRKEWKNWCDEQDRRWERATEHALRQQLLEMTEQDVLELEKVHNVRRGRYITKKANYQREMAAYESDAEELFRT